MADQIVFATDAPDLHAKVDKLFIDTSIGTNLIRPVERFNLRRLTLEADGDKITLVPVHDVLRLMDREYELTENEGVRRLATAIRQATGLT